MALAKEVPGPDGKLDPQSEQELVGYRQVAAEHQDRGARPAADLRHARLVARALLEKGAEQIPALAALKKSDAKAFDKAWKTMREDGAYVEAGENDNVIVQKLEANKNAFGIFGFSFLDENTAKLRGVALDGVEPDYDNIAVGQVQGLASAVRLHQEAARRRRARHRQVRRGVRLAQGARRGRLSCEEGSRHTAEGASSKRFARRSRA